MEEGVEVDVAEPGRADRHVGGQRVGRHAHPRTLPDPHFHIRWPSRLRAWFARPSSSTRSAPRSASARVRCPGGIPPTCSGTPCTALVERTGVDPERIDDVVGGCVTQVGEQGCNVTRNAWVAAGLPQSVAATTVDRQCGSSQQAVHFAAQGVMAGSYDLAIACGVESMTRAPMAIERARRGRTVLARLPRGVRRAVDDPVRGRADPGRPLRRHPRGDGRVRRSRATGGPTRTPTNGHFAREIVPVPVKDEEGRETGEMLTADEGIRPDTTLEMLAGLAARPSGIRRSLPTSPLATRRR